MLFENLSLQEIFRFDAFLAFIASSSICLFLLLTKNWHGKFSMDSTIGVQKMHTIPTPRIGGIAIAAGVLVGFAFSKQDILSAEKRLILSTILLAGIPAFIFGLLEDLTKKVSVKTRLLATMASGILGWGITGVSITHIDIPWIDWMLHFSLISIIFTAFAVGGIANAINIIDGYNGLTAGVILIMLAAFGIIAREIGDVPLAFTCLIVAGAVLGFFIFNWPIGKIFLGDGGAYFLGFTLAWIAVLLPERNPQVTPWTSLLICSYPILEVLFSFYRKSLRVGYHPSQPDGVHLHMLTHKRWSKKLFSKYSSNFQNSMTSPFLWIYASFSCILATFSYSNQYLSTIFLLISFFIYLAFYNRLAFFRWIKKSKFN